jgi:AAA ATPase domain
VHGKRQVGIIAGEPGIGKTALVDNCVAQVSAVKNLRIGHGQCVESYGVGEPYLPVLEALGRLCHEPGGIHLVSVLRQYVPSWLAQMPALPPRPEWEALQRTVGTTGQTRLLRELTEALDGLTVERPLVLVVERIAAMVPVNLLALIELQLAHLSSEDQTLLEAASMAGIEFSSAAVEAALEPTEEAVDAQCTALARQEQFLQACCRDVDLPNYFPRVALTLGAAYTLCGRIDDAVPMLERGMEQPVAQERHRNPPAEKEHSWWREGYQRPCEV